MIEVVCLNPAMDRTLLIPDFATGSINRSQDLVTVAGGKGLNAARFIKCLDPFQQVTVTGFVGGQTGNYIVDECVRLGIDETFVRIQEATRVCVIVVERGRTTVINEDGPVVREDEVARFEECLKDEECLKGRPHLAMICGSVPPGVPSSLYKDLVHSYKDRHVPVYLDAGGDALQQALDAIPTIVKVNEQEFIGAVQGHKICDEDELIFHADQLIKKGTQAVMITRGKEGSLVITKDDIAILSFSSVTVINSIACGDAYFAGVAVGMMQGRSIVASAVLGAAAATLKLGSFAPLLEGIERLAMYQEQIAVVHRKRGA